VPGGEATFVWTAQSRVQNGSYLLRCWGQDGESIALSLYARGETGEYAWLDFTPSLTFQEGGVVTYGVVKVGGSETGSTQNNRLRLRVRNDSVTETAHLDYVTLEPTLHQAGVININTASPEVLSALPGMSIEVAQALVVERMAEGPFGERDQGPHGITFSLGLGDVLLSDALISDLDEEVSDAGKIEARRNRFRLISNFIDVKSDVFEIISTAQTLKEGKVLAEGKIRAVVQR